MASKPTSKSLVALLLPYVRFEASPSRIIERFQTLLRTLGLSVLTFYSFRRDPKDEPPKVLLQSSVWVAVARCTVHIAPALVSIGLIAFNLSGYFIGSELQGPKDQDDIKLGLLQVAAKVQELLVVASVGSVIFHIIRSELVFGEGVPLGLLVSGWNFSQIQYFWSAEFLGGLRCNQTMSRIERWKRRSICLFIAVGGLFALLAGPAAALLMIPREVDWPVGGGIYWLNGSDEQLWPTKLDAAFYSDFDCSNQDTQFLDSRCPSAGIPFLQQYFTTWWNHMNTGFSFELRDFTMRKMVYSRPALRSETNTWAYTAHAATATLQDAMRNLHYDSLDYLNKHSPWKSPYPKHLVFANPIRFVVETRIPAARVFCQPKGVVWLWDRNLTVEFPSIREFDEWWDIPSQHVEEKSLHEPTMKSIDVLKFIQQNLADRGVLNNSSSPLSDEIFQDGRRTLIFPIDDVMKSTNNSLDLVILLGATWNRTSDEVTPPSNILTCSVDARWVKAKTVMELKSYNQLAHEYHLGRVGNLVETESNFLSHKHTLGYIRYKPPSDGSWPTIRLSGSWYNMLAPMLPDKQVEKLSWPPFPLGSKQTTLEALLNMTYDPQSTTTAGFEIVIATSVVDGLSRSGLIPNYNGSRFLEAWPFTKWTVENDALARTMVRQGEPIESFPEPMILKPNATRMVMKATYRGYVMKAIGWFDYLSVAALLAHALLAFIHSGLLLYSQTTSGAWDTILELVVLSHQSEPPPESILANTSAGVTSSRTVKLVAYIDAPDERTTSVSSNHLQPRGELQMRLREPGKRPNSLLKPTQVGQVYGSSTNDEA